MDFTSTYMGFSKAVKSVIVLFALLLLCARVFAYEPNTKTLPADEVPAEFKEAKITEKLGQFIDPELTFYDESGEVVQLGQFLKAGRPTVLSIVYYECPSLCNYHLNGVTKVINKIDKTVGKDFDLISISMNHREGPEVASDKKEAYLTQYKRPTAREGWHFLTGSEENIKKLADSVGFGFKWDEKTQQYAHSAAAIVLSPKGKITRYLYGIEFDPKTFTLALLEGSNGKIGNVIEQLVLFCFRYDPGANKYSLYAFNLMRVAALVTVIVLALFLVPVWLRKKKSNDPT